MKICGGEHCEVDPRGLHGLFMKEWRKTFFTGIMEKIAVLGVV